MRISLTRGRIGAACVLAVVGIAGIAAQAAPKRTPTPHPRRAKTAARRVPTPTPRTAAHVPGTITPFVATATPAATPTADPYALSAADKRELAEIGLQWAVDGGLSDFALVKDPVNLIVSNANLPDKSELKLTGRTLTVLSPQQIQERANKEGDFLYFRFGAFIGYKDRARVTVGLVWAVSSQSESQYLSGGGATLKFERRDGKWTLLPVTNRWMS